MEDATLGQLIANTRVREWSLRIVDNWGNPESLTSLWHRTLSEEFLAGADAACLLNSDCWVGEEWWPPIVQALEDPFVAVAGPQSNCGAQTAPSEITQPTVRGWIPDPPMLARAAKKCRELWPGQVREAEISGHCYCLRRDVWHRLSGFSVELRRGYTLYGSEWSLNARARSVGMKTVAVMDSYAFHVGQASGKRGQEAGILDLKEEQAKGRALFFGGGKKP